MKTIYYYLRWVIKNYEYESLHSMVLSAVLSVTGAMFTALSWMIDPKKEEHGLIIGPNQYFNHLSNIFFVLGAIAFGITGVHVLIIQPIRNSFRRFRAEQHQIFDTLSHKSKTRE